MTPPEDYTNQSASVQPKNKSTDVVADEQVESGTKKEGVKRARKRALCSPSSNCRRRSRRGSSSLSLLAKAIAENRRVVFVTGAGLSVSSGIRPFRGDGGLWTEVLYSNATREAFRKDPLDWYNQFWLKHFPASYEAYKPNAGHEALAQLTILPSKHPSISNNVRVITQNVDGLHSRTECLWDYETKLIEAHGRVGLYKCIPDEDSDSDSDSDDEADREVQLGNRRKYRVCVGLDGTTRCIHNQSQGKEGSSGRDARPVCKYEMQESIPASELKPPKVRTLLSTDSKLEPNNDCNTKVDVVLPSPPLCPFCQKPCAPQSLLFDEGYHSHSHYDFLRMEKWISEAEILVFVGTSFSVTVTDVSLRHAMEKGIPVFNFNLHERLSSNRRLNVENIMGDATETLPVLLNLCLLEVRKYQAS